MIKKILLLSLIAVFFCSNLFVSAKTVVRFQDWHMAEDVWMKCLQEIKADYEKLHPEVEIAFEPISLANKAQKFVVASEAKNAPDVVHCEFVDLPPYYAKGYLLNLNDLIKKEGKDFMKQWADGAVSRGTYKGKIYAIPDDAQTMVMFWNTELFKQAGLDPNKPPKTWPEFREYATKLTNHKDQWGFGLCGGPPTSMLQRFLPVLWSFGGDVLNDKTTKCMLDTPDSIAAFKFYVELYTKDGSTPPAPNEMSAQDVRTFLAQKKIALDFGSGWTVSIVSKLNPDLKAAEVLNCAPMPIGKKHTTFAVMDFWGISAFTKNQDAAWSWVKYLSSKDVTIKMFKDNGVTSSRIDVAQSDIIKNDKFASVISSQIPYARTMSMYEGLGEVNDAVNVAMQEALTKQKTPEVALKDATAKINGILNRYKK